MSSITHYDSDLAIELSEFLIESNILLELLDIYRFYSDNLLYKRL